MSYEYRNLPCTVGTWYVSGKDRVGYTQEILEWCYDEQDALETMARMHRDPRFVDLSVKNFDEECDKLGN